MTVQQTPYIQEQRHFPKDDMQDLSAQMDIAYIDIARKINERVIGQYSQGFSAVTGQRWFLNGQPTPQQTLRQVYPITGAGTYPHGINTAQIQGFTRIYGIGFATPNWYPLPYVSSTDVTDQIEVFVDPTNINIVAGAGAPPTLTSGYVILEWLAVF